jgi:hypothetical protein
MPVSISNLTSTWANSYFNYIGLGLNVNATEYNENSSIIKFSINDDEKLKLSPNGTLYVNGISLTTQTTELAELAYDKANSAYDIAIIGGGEISVVTIAAYDKANAANLLAYNTGIGANAFTSATIAGANTAVGAGANAFTTSTNTFLRSVIAGANTAVGAGANAFTTSTNTFLRSVIAGANTAVGTGANAFTTSTNTFLRSVIAGANTAVGAGANAFTSATIAGANTAVGAGANAFTTSTNTFLRSVIAGANTAVGAGANAYAASVGAGANAYLLSVIAGANTAVGTGANAYATATFLPSSSYTASDILTKIKTVDGSGSGLDADTVDGIQAASFLRSDAADTATGDITLKSGTFTNYSSTNTDITGLIPGSTGGGLIYAPSSAHLIIGLRENDVNDSFAIISGGGNYSTDITYDTVVARFLSNGNSHFGGNITVTGTVDGRDIATDGTKLDGIESGATADQTASEILSALLTVDGVGSGLDADLLDGYAASVGSTSGPADTIVLRNSSGDDYRRYGFASYFNMSHSVTTRSSETVFFSSTDSYIRKNDATGMRASLNVPTRTGGDASGTWGISITGDAGTLDGLDSTSFLRSNASDVFSGGVLQVYNDSAIDITNTGQINGLQVYQPTAGADALITFHVGGDYAFHFGLSGDDNQLSVGGWSMGANKYKVWHAGNDGSGSGLDADTLDTYQASDFPRKTENATISGDWIFNETINFNSTTATSLSTGAAWFSGSSGAILLDNGGHKRISWNDGGGNFNIRAGHYFNGSVIAAKGTNESDGGAVALVMSSDSAAGVFSVSVAPITVAGQTISSWTNTLKVDTTATSAGAGGLKYNEAQVWHAGNDGSGSGLDADLLDGEHGSYYSPLTITQLAYDKANSANLLAYNTGIGANAYSTATFLAKTGGIINGTLEVGGTSVSGAEGGEIRFTKAPTSTLSGSSIVLDNNGNNIRIFESGGTFRGYTFDLSTAGAGASTTLLNSTNLWSTMNMVNVKSYGAIGNGSNDDTSSINSAIAYINSNGGILYFPKGNYKVTSALTSITKGGIKIVGDGIGNTVITPVGTFTLFTIGGTSTRVYWMNIENIYIYGLNHTGIVFNLDHTQGISFYNVFLDNCYNPVNMRQVHNTTFEDFYCENIRGNYGMKIYASGSTRNSTTERSDILNLERVILAGNNSAGSSHANSCKLLHIDGFIASIYMDKVQLLRGHTGIYCVNSPGLPYGSYPQFIQGQNLDLEFNYYNAAYISHLEGLNITNLYCHGAVTDIGMNFGTNTSGIRLSNGKIAGHAAFGAVFNGTGIGLTDIDVYNNGTAVPNGYDGIYLSSTVNGFQMIGGSAGKAPWFSYTETQRYGINISSGAARSQLIGVRLNGNATGTYFGSATTSGLVTS